MQTIRCAKCNRRIMKYKKVGKGKLLRCWKEKIKSDLTVREGDSVLCPCGNLIGIEEKLLIRMRQSSFIRSGGISRK